MEDDKQPVVSEKAIFNQAQLDFYVGTTKTQTKADTTKAIFDDLGISSKEEYAAVKEKASKYDEANKTIEAYKAKDVKQAQIKLIQESGVDPEYADYVNSQVEHGEEEATFKANLDTYLEAHPKMKKEVTIKINSNPALGGNGVSPTRGQLNNMSSEQLQAFFKSQEK